MEPTMAATDRSDLLDHAQADPAQATDRFQTFNAILLALVTLLGAFVVWRSAVAADAAGDENVAGILATLNVEQTRAINTVLLFENYRAYTGYTRYAELGNKLYDALDECAGRTKPRNRAQGDRGVGYGRNLRFPTCQFES